MISCDLLLKVKSTVSCVLCLAFLRLCYLRAATFLSVICAWAGAAERQAVFIVNSDIATFKDQ